MKLKAVVAVSGTFNFKNPEAKSQGLLSGLNLTRRTFDIQRKEVSHA
jgi:hypothetical protein